jgi:hypothetical protein
MSDLNGKSMSELIALHNELAEKLGVSTETEFKNLKAARSAVATLESKMEQATNPATEADGAAAGAAAVEGVTKHVLADSDKQKYNSSGKRGPNQGVGAFSKELILAGLSNADVLTQVIAKFPDAKTSKGCIAFYRTALSKSGKETGPTPEQLRKQAQDLLDKATATEAAQAAAAEALAAAEAAKASSAAAFDASVAA